MVHSCFRHRSHDRCQMCTPNSVLMETNNRFNPIFFSYVLRLQVLDIDVVLFLLVEMRL